MGICVVISFTPVVLRFAFNQSRLRVGSIFVGLMAGMLSGSMLSVTVYVGILI